MDPAPAMLDLARTVAGTDAGDRLELIEGTVADAPDGPFDAATCILVLGLLPDDGAKLDLLVQTRRRLAPGAPFLLVDQCIDRLAPDAERRFDRYADYARLSGVDAEVVAGARAALQASRCLVPAERDEALLLEAGFCAIEVFYVGLSWRGWVALA